jgi:molybdopterin-synthase adenylyltransferase
MSRHARQSFLGPKSERIIQAARIAIVGLGGGGSPVAQQLAHVGIAHFLLFDPDAIDDTNLNRLVGGTPAYVQDATKKVYIAERLIHAINPTAEVKALPVDWRDECQRLRDVDIVVACVDTFHARFELETAARRYLTPCIDIGMDVYEHGKEFLIAGQVALSLPGRPCLQCMGIIQEDQLERERYGAAGGRPQMIWPNSVLASAAVGIVLQLLTPWFQREPGAILLRLEGNTQTLTDDPWVQQHRNRACPHYPLADLGDPFFNAKEIRPDENKNASN